MASEYQRTTIGTLIAEGALRLQTGPFGSQLHQHDYKPTGVPVIPTEGIGRGRINSEAVLPRISKAKAIELGRHRLIVGDILFARRGVQATGLSAYVDETHEGSICGTGALLLRTLSERIDPRFLSAYLATDEAYEWLRAHAVGAVMPNLNTEIISALSIPVPSISIQKQIANLIFVIDDRIDHNCALAANLETIARALFKSWFVDFDPVRAKAAGEAPPGLVPDLAALFPDRFVDSELGEIPEGWDAATLVKVCSLNPESWTGRKHPDQIEYVDLANVKAGDIEKRASYSWDESPSRARRVLRSGDTIVGTVRPGNRSFALISENGLTGSTGFAALRPNFEWLREFVYLAATSDDAIDRLTHLADGAAYPAVRPDVVVATEAVIPSEDVAKEFSAILRPLIDRASASRSESAALTQLRNLLLPRLISGKLRVEDAEAALEAA